MDEQSKKINTAVEQVINTLKFYGVELVRMELKDNRAPFFQVKIIDDLMKRDLNTTLNITYWTLWTLIYGSRDDTNHNLSIKLEYDYQTKSDKKDDI